MSKIKETLTIARVIFNAYPHADLLPIDYKQDCRDLQTLFDKVTGQDIGDSLFKFIVIEMVEGGDSTLDGAIQVMRRAIEDVEAVLRALSAESN